MSHPPEGLLPPFPVDPSTLDLIETALHPGPTSQTSSVGQLCDLYSALAGSDLDAVDHVSDGGVRVMRDPHYHPNDIIDALLAEVRRLRAHPDPPGGSP